VPGVALLGPWQSQGALGHDVPVGGRFVQPFDSSKVNLLGMDLQGIGPGEVTVEFVPPKGSYIWPAIWMMPKDPKLIHLEMDHPPGWLEGGEIDFMETMGNRRGDGHSGKEFAFYNDENAMNEGSALHFGVHTDKVFFNFFPTMWTKIMGDLGILDHTYAPRSSSDELRRQNKFHTNILQRDDDNLAIYFKDGITGQVFKRLDVDAIFRVAGERYDKGELMQEIFHNHGIVPPHLKGNPHSEHDRQVMRNLLKKYGYQAGRHCKEENWTPGGPVDQFVKHTSSIISSYVLYELGVFGVSQDVMPLNQFQNAARFDTSHAAPFCGKWQLQFNVAIGGGFFEGNMNADMTLGGPEKPLPWVREDKKVSSHTFMREHHEWWSTWAKNPEEPVIKKTGTVQKLENQGPLAYDYWEFPEQAEHTRFIIGSATYNETL
jgi:hypothetical protein